MFINIYGGINPIHEGAQGIARYLKEHDVKIPIVAKALGNHQEETWEIFKASGIHVTDGVSTEEGIDLHNEASWKVIMSILLDKNTRVLVQGITGRAGRTQTRWMLDYGTNIVAGVTPGKGGEIVEGIPVYSTVAEAVQAQGAEASVFFIPPPGH